MKLHHIGYLVKNVNQAKQAFMALGYKPIAYNCKNKEIVFDETRQADIVFLRMGEQGETIELVSPLNEESPVWNLMKRYKNTPYHLCYECEDIQQAIKDLTENGWGVFQQPAVAPAIYGRNVVFLVNRFCGIIELVESSGRHAQDCE